MEVNFVRRHNSAQPVLRVWNEAKNLDNGQKLELMTMLIESFKPVVAGTDLQPYTKNELLARIEKSEQQFVNGQYQDFEEAMEDLEREFAEEDKKLEMEESI